MHCITCDSEICEDCLQCDCDGGCGCDDGADTCWSAAPAEVLNIYKPDAGAAR